MSEKIHIPLRCPVCERTGTAVVREPDDYAAAKGARYVRVYEMPDGFKAVDRERGAFDGVFDVDCSEHGVSVIGNG